MSAWETNGCDGSFVYQVKVEDMKSDVVNVPGALRQSFPWHKDIGIHNVCASKASEFCVIEKYIGLNLKRWICLEKTIEKGATKNNNLVWLRLCGAAVLSIRVERIGEEADCEMEPHGKEIIAADNKTS
jgi:hypothetical protein